MTHPQSEREDPRAFEEEKDRLFVTALARGLDVLAAFRPGDATLSNQQIASRTQLPKSTVSRLTYTLVKLGYLKQESETGLYRLGFSVLELASSLLASFDVRAIAAPLMREFAQTLHVSVSLAVRDGSHMVYLETCRSQSRISVEFTVGSRVPLATTAIGRACYAGLSEENRLSLDSELSTYYKQTWPTHAKRLQEGLDDCRRQGYCTSFGEFEPDVCAIGMPLVLPGVNESLALNASIPAFLFDEQIMRTEIAPALQRLAAAICARG